MLTFVAILVALKGVHYHDETPADPVSGIGGLINGLSGKFLSSIVALFLSVVFTLIEKSTVRGVRRSYENLIAVGSSLLPYLSPSHILLDLQRFASKQTVSVSHISSEVVDRLVSAFQTQVSPALAESVSSGMAGKLQDEFRPTMQRMSETLEQLHSAIVRIQSQKQESVASELRGLLESLESSLVGALGEMGTQFHNALTGAASQEFGNVQGTLEATRQMLSEMNTQFASMQAAFAGVIQKAEQSTTTQLETGKQQTEALAQLMEGLMVKLQETADNNVTSIRSQLTLVVSDLAQKVGTLSQDFMTAAQNATRESQASAQHLVEQTGNWSEATARRLEALVNSIEARSGEFQAAGATLLQLQHALKETINENAQALARMADASRQVQTYSTALAGQAGTLETLNKHQVQVTAQLKQTSANVDTAFQRHDDFLKQYRQVFERYESVFKGLASTLGSLLATIQKGMQQYTQSVEHNFQEIVKTANQMLPDIVKKLDAQTGDPRLRAANWAGMDPAATAKFLKWIAKESIVFFFNHVLPDNSANERRKDFWLEYVGAIKDFQVALSDLHYDRLYASSRLKDVPGFGRVDHDKTSAFIMNFSVRGGEDIIVAEFSDTGNAAHVFIAPAFERKAGSLRSIRFEFAKLKHEANEDRILHLGAWEYYARNKLARWGVRR
jgi:hypothetical protein